MSVPAEGPTPTTFERAIAVLESSDVEPDPDAPSCFQYRLRPSEMAAIYQDRAANPPPPWGKKISLAKAFLGPDKCLTLGHKLILNRTVTFLDLSMCNLRETAAPEFFLCVQRNKVLRHLNVTGNAIGDAGAVAAAPCVLQLESLHLGSNGITDVGAVAIASALALSMKIKMLNLRSNRITQYGIYKVLMALEDVSAQLPEDVLAAVKGKDTTTVSDFAKVTLMSAQTSLSDARLSTKGSISEAVVSGRRAGAGGAPASTTTTQTGESPKREENLIDSHPSLFSVETVEQRPVEPAEEKPVLPTNETLHALWIENNVDIPTEMHTIVTTIMEKRFPPPPPKPKKKKSAKTANGPDGTKKK